ncbi:MAG: hypothetical protein IT572_00200 [Deltaproteobacteria bacterium]|nr:hypothetical protein [Deltaproteobacteria bacterium]
MMKHSKTNFHALTGLTLAILLALQPGCSDNKNAGTGGSTSNVGAEATGAATAPTDCQPGQYTDASGRAKTHLKLQPNLYPGMVVYASSASIPAFQDAYKKDATLYFAKSIPMGFIYAVNGTLVDKVLTDTPPMALKFYEDQGKVLLAVGHYNGLDFYEVGASSIQKVKSDAFLGLVTDLAARDGQLCAIADGGRAVVKTSLQAASGNACGQVLYQMPEPPAGVKPALAHHVGATPDGCALVTRNLRRFEWRMGSLFDWIFNMPKSPSGNLDLNQINDRLLWLKNDGSVKEITPSIGNYNKVFFSDLSGFPDGVIATFTAFKSANLNSYATSGDPWDLIESFFEIRAGGVFVVDGEIKKSVELSGLQGPWLIAGHTLDEFPHFSLPYFPAGAVGGNQYAIKGIFGLSMADFSNYKDPNVTSLPVTERSIATDPVLGGAGIFTDMQLVEDKLFLGGLANAHVLGVYDLTNKDVLDLSNPAGVYHPMPSKLNLGVLPLAATRNGMVGAVPASGKFFYKPGDRDYSNVVAFQLKQFFNPAWPLADYQLEALPSVFESPAGEGGDRVAYAHIEKTTEKLIVELLNNDGSKVAVSDTEVGVEDVSVKGPTLGAIGFQDDLLVVGTNRDSVAFKDFKLNVFAIAGDTLKHQTWNTVIPDGPGDQQALKVLGMRKAGGDNYHVYLFARGADPLLTRITFSRSGSNVDFVERKDVVVDKMISAVLAETKAYGIGTDGKITPVNLENMTAEPSLGSITPNVFISVCGLVKNSIYCSSLGKKFEFWMHSFDLDTKQSTYYPHHQPFLLSVYGSRLMASYSIDGGGAELIDLTNAAPEAAPIESSSNNADGGAIGSGNENTTTSGDSAAGGVPAGGAVGGGGCSLGARAQTAGIGALFIMACLVGAALMARRLRRLPARR